MSETRPSLVRFRALEQYQQLRKTIDELEAVAAKLLSEGEAVLDEALECTSKLLVEISDYVDLEQLFVLPTVRNADIWGDLRADRLVRDHQSQRAGLFALQREQRGAVTPDLLAADLHAFAEEMRKSLEREEHEVLSSELMRDDVIGLEPD